ncbi:MAG TPA: DoxX family protein [bacterium]|nr:DoxX family protein [bacterium]
MSGSTFGRDRWGLIGVRMIVGALFIVHGWPKLAAGGGGPAFAGGLAHMGFHPAALWAWIVTSVEFGGGLCLLLGVLVRPAAALLVIEMLVAIIKVNWARGFYWTHGGWEMPALMALLAAVLAMTAPGTTRPGRPPEHPAP